MYECALFQGCADYTTPKFVFDIGSILFLRKLERFQFIILFSFG